jgi:hypothetical protein
MTSGVILLLATAPLGIGFLIDRLVGKYSGRKTKRIGQMLTILAGVSVIYSSIAVFPFHGGALGDAHANLHAFGSDGAWDEFVAMTQTIFLVMMIGAFMAFSWIRSKRDGIL